MAKTPYSQYTGLGSIPGATTKRPSIMQLSQINIKKEKKEEEKRSRDTEAQEGHYGMTLAETAVMAMCLQVKKHQELSENHRS